jgi:molybdopterin synthase catalytic subunit
MHLTVQLGPEPIPATLPAPLLGPGIGALAEFRGLVRGEEKGAPISALVYEAYRPMAEREITRILESLLAEHPCHAVHVHHRLGRVPVGEAAIYVAVAARHRAEAFAVLAGFMDRLKQDVPIWKTDALPAAPSP